MNLYDVYSLYDVELVHGQGAQVYDSNGVGYLDFYGGHAVISVGHNHPHYTQTITNQLHRLSFYSNSVINSKQQELADKLEALSGVEGYDIFFINSGAEANENALKLASFHNGRTKVIALDNGFHGRTSAAINVTQTGIKHQAPINAGVNVEYFSKDNTDAIVAAIGKGDVSAIIIEAIQGVGGLDAITAEAAQAIEAACSRTDTILILDEVQCGYGRSGKFFAYQYLGISPDIITMAKGMGNGFPIGGVLINSEKLPASKGRLGTTYGGNQLACAAGIAVLDIIKAEGLVHSAKSRGEQLSDELKKVKGVKKVKGKGLMMGVEFDFKVADLRKQLVFDQKLFTGSSTNPNLLRILPPLNITDADMDAFLTRLNAGVNKL